MVDVIDCEMGAYPFPVPFPEMIHYQCMMMTVHKALTRVCFMDFDMGKVKYDHQAQSRIVSPCKFISDLSCSYLNPSHFFYPE
jgi:hypothetical protein